MWYNWPLASAFKPLGSLDTRGRWGIPDRFRYNSSCEGGMVVRPVETDF